MSVTIKDIAQFSGVSYSTVSKALNNSPLVKPETKRAILKVAEELGYQPNFSARNLVSKKSDIIGVVWPTIEKIALSALISEINKIIEKKDYSMILSISKIESSVEMFRRFQVDGILIFEEDEKAFIDPSILKAVPVLSHGVPKDNPYPIVDANHKRALYKAVQYLHDLKHTDISFIGDLNAIDLRQKAKTSGFQEAMQELQLPIKENSFVDAKGLSWYDGYVATKSLLENNNKPTAIIGGSYDISVGILRAVNEKGLEVPKNISIIGYDNIPQMASLETPLTSVGVPICKLASTIVHSLLTLIEHDETDIPLVQTLTPELNDRGSCCPPETHC